MFWLFLNIFNEVRNTVLTNTSTYISGYFLTSFLSQESIFLFWSKIFLNQSKTFTVFRNISLFSVMFTQLSCFLELGIFSILLQQSPT